MRLRVPITVEFGSSSDALLDAGKTRAVERFLSPELGMLLQGLGLAGEPEIEFRSVSSGRVVQVRVHGELQPYPPDLMKRVWRALAPTDLRGLPEITEMADYRGFPDAWLKRILADLSVVDDDPDWGPILEYLARLVFEIIRERPACLVGPLQTAAYLEEGANDLPFSRPSDIQEELSSILKALLGLGVSVEAKSMVLQAHEVGRKFGRSTEDVIEGLFAQLRSDLIEIHVHPDYLQLMVSGRQVGEPLPVYAERIDEDLREQFRFMESSLFSEVGVLLPDLVLMPSPEVREGMLAIKINGHLGLPIPGLRLGELLVNAPVEELTALKVPGRPAIEMVDGNVCAVVSEVHKGTVEEAGYTTWTLVQFVVLALSDEIRRMADRLLSIEDVENRLVQLQDGFPDLIEAATEHCSVADSTRVMRGLLREDLSIRDMRAILERLLRFETVPIDLGKYVVFDDRLAVKEGTPPGSVYSWENYLEFVRGGLKYYIVRRYARGQDRLNVLLIDPELETRVEEAMETDGQPADARVGLTEVEREAFRDTVWAEGGNVLTTLRPAILTKSSIRAAVRNLIAPELHNLPVVAYSELPPTVNIEFVGRISLA